MRIRFLPPARRYRKGPRHFWFGLESAGRLRSGMATEPSPARLWAEQLALGLAFLIGLLIFMAFYYPALLSRGGQVLTAGDLAAYGWASVVGVALHLILHEIGALVAAKRFGLPLRFRFFPFGVNAAATLSATSFRRVWVDAMVGLAGPVTGTALSLLSALIYFFTDNPFFLGMACVGCFLQSFHADPDSRAGRRLDRAGHRAAGLVRRSRPRGA